MKLRKSDWWDIVIAAGIVAVVICVASVAGAGTVCRVQKVVQPLVSGYAEPLISYRVAAPLRDEATATYQFRHSDEYIELQQLRGFKAGVDAVTASGDRPSSPPQPAWGHPAVTEGGQTTPPVSDFAARYPTLAAKCSTCHGGDTPDGDVFIDGSVPLDGPDAATKRDAIARAMVNERMPKKGKKLEDQELFDALIQLFTETVSGEKDEPPSP